MATGGSEALAGIDKTRDIMRAEQAKTIFRRRQVMFTSNLNK
jgi:hypothetical protein